MIDEAKQQVDAYLALMAEVKARLGTVQSICELEEQFGLQTAYEFSFLQFRYITELVAMACLLVHSQLDNKEMKALRQRYEAKAIFKKLTLLYPDFLMVSVKQTTKDGHVHFIPDRTKGFTAKDLSDLWDRSGRVLHVGQYKQLHRRNTPDDAMQQVRGILDRLSEQFNEHFVLTKCKTRAMICQLSGGPEGSTYVALGVPSDEILWRSERQERP